MDEYISREAIVKEIKEEIKACDVKFVEDIQIKKGLKIALKDIKAAKVADVQLVKHGRWIIKGQEIYCSECDTESSYNSFGASQFTRFCPNCGARMDGDK